MRLAQFQFIKELKGISPILLLDDIFDKLDDKRVKNLIELVSDGLFGQIFVTDTSEKRIMAILNEIGRDYEIFHISKGKVVHESVI